MKRLFGFLSLAVLTLTLSACGTMGGKPGHEAAVVDQSTSAQGAGAGGGAGAQASGAGTEGGFQGSPINNPASPLYKKTVYFAFDSSVVNAEGQKLVAAHAKYLAAHPDLHVRLQGYTDERGSPEYNIALGWRRAQSVRQLMVVQGVKPDQISMISYGEEHPAVLGHDESAWRYNRRVEIVYTGQQ
ncbi:MAG: peptidoglycan-associated lipoprotein Pal [Gammaproteobacteria bacterium]|jgi:peptidoglycan-associated lipoprotein